MDIPSASSVIRPRKSEPFASSMVDGRTVGELNPRSRSAAEMTSLWQYVLTQLRKDGKRA